VRLLNKGGTKSHEYAGYTYQKMTAFGRSIPHPPHTNLRL
jgi:hypothetical protein